MNLNTKNLKNDFLYSTKDYNAFELSANNRDADKLAKLRTSFKEKGFTSAGAIRVVRLRNGKLKIIGGHHRFEVAQELGLAVWFIINEDVHSIYELEAATNHWTMKDWLTSYVREGLPEYDTVAEYCKRTGIGLSSAISMLGGNQAGSGNMIDRFKEGKFVVKDTAHAEDVARVVQAMVSVDTKWGTIAGVVNAASKIVLAECVDVDVLVTKIVKYSFLLEKQPCIDAYLEMFERVYNRQASKGTGVSVAFLAREGAKRRALNFSK